MSCQCRIDAAARCKAGITANELASVALLPSPFVVHVPDTRHSICRTTSRSTRPACWLVYGGRGMLSNRHCDSVWFLRSCSIFCGKNKVVGGKSWIWIYHDNNMYNFSSYRVQILASPLSSANPGLVVNTRVPRSPSSMIWYQLRLGR